jgi:hypothetical protein
MVRCNPIPAVSPERQRLFWSVVDKTSHPNGCWVWTGRNQFYGRFITGSPKKYSYCFAHRLSYTWLRGPIPPGLYLDHLCRNTLCVNPDHLEAVTIKVNTHRGVSNSAVNARKTHCSRGHLLTPENIRPRPKKRDCAICANLLRRLRRRADVRRAS